MADVIFDTETDGLLDAVTKVHCLQIGDPDGDDGVVYGDHPLCDFSMEAGLNRLAAADHAIGHNLIGFDLKIMQRFFPGALSFERCKDTLVMARLADPEQRDHTLDGWGRRLGILKGKYSGDFQKIDEELITYARQDIHATRPLWHKFKHVEAWGSSCRLEHEVTAAIVEQERHGFFFDIVAAEKLDMRLRSEIDVVGEQLQGFFPPIDRELTRVMGATNSKFGYVKGQPFTKKWVETFNPGSRKQVGERLIALGWKPKAFGDDGIPALDDNILAGMKHPAAKPLREYFRLQKKIGMLSDGKAGWLKLVKPDGRIHGRVNPNGARTGRMTHSKPNTAQVDKDHDMRALWTVPKGRKLVGVDGEGIQLRVLAHYLFKYDGGQLAERIVSGKKSERTDPHSANLRALIDARVLPTVFWDDKFNQGRDGAKTFIYAKLFGSTDGGLGRTAHGVYREAGLIPPRLPLMELGKLGNIALARSMTGLDKLEAKAQGTLKEKKFLIGLDGRRIYSTQPRLALVSLCQGGEAAIMKKALSLFYFEAAPAKGWQHGVDYGLVANVHDEDQIEAYDPANADAIGLTFAACITEAGVRLGFKCPLAGLHQVGNNWAETH